MNADIDAAGSKTSYQVRVGVRTLQLQSVRERHHAAEVRSKTLSASRR